MANLWLARGTALPDQNTVEKLISGTDQWQIMQAFSGAPSLAVKPALYDRWVENGYVSENLFVLMGTPEGPVRVFAGKKDYLLSSVQHGPYPQQATEAHLFAITLRRARKTVKAEISLHDALYIEQLSLILPAFAGGSADDRRVLGTWMAGGVNLSTDQFDRLCELASWIPRSEVKRIVADAGFDTEINRDPSAPQVKKLDPDARFCLPGRPELEAFFNENIVEVVAREEQYKRMGIGFPGAVVLHGPPGCGKTYAVERLVEFLGWPCYHIDSGSIGSTFIHETGMRIAGVFDKAAKSAPAVVVIDEMESFLADRETGSNNMHHMEEVAEFLRRIPEAAQKRVLVFGMTNRLKAIDPAIIRRGRFDHMIEVKMPSAEDVYAMLTAQMKDLPVEADANIMLIARRLKGRPLSDAAFVLREAGRLAVRRNLDKISTTVLLDAVSLLPDEQKTASRKIGF